MPNDLILARHQRILSAVAELEKLVAGERPELVDGLAARRWAFTRQVLEHCSFMTALLGKLARDQRPVAAARANLSHDETTRFVDYFRAHVARWHGFPAEQEWADYQRAIRRLTISIRQLLDSEVRHILPLLPPQIAVTTDTVPPARPQLRPMPEPRYAEETKAVRKLIYDDNGRPVGCASGSFQPEQASPRRVIGG